MSSGGVKCWGLGNDGQLGNKGNGDKDAPVDVVTSSSDTDPLMNIVQVSLGVNHTCALTAEGTVKCWGYNDVGQLGHDCIGASCPSTNYPVDVVAAEGNASPLSGIVQISVAGSHTCALKTGGGVVCWGNGRSGQLGNGATDNKDAPVTVTTTGTTALTGIASISSGGNHTCALKSAGGVVCWGSGSHGRLGNNTAGTDQSHPVDVLTSDDGNPALASIAQVGLGNGQSCAVTTGGGGQMLGVWSQWATGQ